MPYYNRDSKRDHNFSLNSTPYENPKRNHNFDNHPKFPGKVSGFRAESDEFRATVWRGLGSRV